MTLDPARLFAIAERHLQTGSEEAEFRTAVNRAYYACHLTARDRLYGLDAERWSGRAGRRPSHIAVIAVVAERLETEHSDALQRLKKMREVADYIRDVDHPEAQSVFRRESVGGWEGLATEALSLARGLLPPLQAMSAVPA